MNYSELNKTLQTIEEICNEWKTIKKNKTNRSGWMFDYKLYDLSYKCEDSNDFEFAAEMILEEWKESARIAAGYIPETWDYNKYFEHDNHHGSYFTFKEQADSATNLDFWSENIGLEWDVKKGDAWSWTPFEKAIYETYSKTRFSTDKLTPDVYDKEEIQEITETLVQDVIPALQEQLKERKAVIEAYENLKVQQCEYLECVCEAV